jgi:polyphenol oxidase
MTEILIHAAMLDAILEVRHAFFTRKGGVSSGSYESNNCSFGSNDNAENVFKNRAACIARLGMSALATAQQKHTSNVVEVESIWSRDAAPVADALVTRMRGVALGILTADCAPVLLAERETGIVAAAHAGWKGACGGILENTVDAMSSLGAKPDRIVAVVGPCIAQISYEVGPEFTARFKEMNANFAHYFTDPKANGHTHFDLAAFAADRLRECGVEMVTIQGGDTCADEQRFFSYRRSVLHQEPECGRQLSAIGLAEE